MARHIHIHIHRGTNDEHEGFQKLESEFKREGKRDPGGLAYSIGVKKFGKKGMAAKAAAGRK